MKEQHANELELNMISFSPSLSSPLAGRRQLWIEMADNKVSPLHYQEPHCHCWSVLYKVETFRFSPVQCISSNIALYQTCKLQLGSHVQYISIALHWNIEHCTTWATFPLHYEVIRLPPASTPLSLQTNLSSFTNNFSDFFFAHVYCLSVSSSVCNTYCVCGFLGIGVPASRAHLRFFLTLSNTCTKYM